MPVLTCRVAVALDVTNEFSVCLAGCIETERSLDLVVFEVAVDGLRAADYLYAVLLGCVVLSEYTSICVRVVATDDNESLDAEFAENLNTLLELLFLLELSTSRADDVETTGIAILDRKSVV